MKRSLGAVIFLLLLASKSAAQTVVELDVDTTGRLLECHKMGAAVVMLEMLANNYKKFTNVRVVSNRWSDNLSMLAQALRHDFDGAGPAYIAQHNIWLVSGASGSRIYLMASLVDNRAVLLAESLDMLRSMTAFEMLQLIRAGRLDVQRALEIAQQVGVEMQVGQDDNGNLLVSFFAGERGVFRLAVVEPPELIWD